jgi:hypothetical protein
MRTAAELRTRLDGERERVDRLREDQPAKARAAARAIAADAPESVVKKLRAERDAGERELTESGDVVRELEAQLASAERAEAEARQAAKVAEAERARGAVEAAVATLVAQTRTATAQLLPLWDAARAADQRARAAAQAATGQPQLGDGEWWRGTGSIRALLLEVDRFARWSGDA